VHYVQYDINGQGRMARSDAKEGNLCAYEDGHMGTGITF
jgi:hypothetical protein